MKRRDFTGLCGASLGIGVAGCLSGPDDAPLDSLILSISNETNKDRTVHFLLESESEISEWHRFNVDQGDVENFPIDVENKNWKDYHIVTGSYQSKGSLLGQATELECIQLNFTINDEEGIIGNFSTNRNECEISTEEQ